jgi:hypothetical protein
MGDYWLRLYSNGKRLAQLVLRLAQLVLSADCAEGGGPAIDDGGLQQLRSHLHLVRECLLAK